MSGLTLDSLVEIRKHHVRYGGNKYFRRNAHRVEICSHGRKKSSAVTVNYMSVSAKIARHHLETVPIKVDGPIEVNWSETTQEDLNHWGSLKFFDVNAEVADGFDHQTAVSQRLKLMCFWINETPLKDCLNNRADRVRDEMAAEGNDARIASSILVVASSQLAEHFATYSSTSLTLNSMSTDIGITAGSTRLSSQTIRLAEGTTFAYGLHKPKKWSKGKAQIEQLEDDWFSFG